MGKASKWFRNLLGLKKPDPIQSDTTSRVAPTKRRWGFVKPNRDKDMTNPVAKHPSHHQNPLTSHYQRREDADIGREDHEERAVAVAAATAMVAQAAVSAGKVATTAVSLTSSSPVTNVRHGVENDGAMTVEINGRGKGTVKGNGDIVDDVELAAIKIQSNFRGYLARTALRALRGLVRLQAMVRGHIERKKTAEYLRRMQALIRAQAMARARRLLHSESLSQAHSKSYQSQNGPPTPEKFELPIRSRSVKNDRYHMLRKSGSKTNVRFINDLKLRTDECSWDQRIPTCRIPGIEDEYSDRTLEIDNGKHHIRPKLRNISHSSHLDQHSHSFATSKDSSTYLTMPLSPSSEVQSLTPTLLTEEISPFYSASCRGNPVTPTKSDGSRSCQTGYSDHPNYMSYTESARAKARSLSAPKQRPQYERSGSAKRYHLYGFGKSRLSSMKVSALQAEFSSKGYPGSGRLDRLGMPVGI